MAIGHTDTSTDTKIQRYYISHCKKEKPKGQKNRIAEKP